jgi:hypothetical protein
MRNGPGAVSRGRPREVRLQTDKRKCSFRQSPKRKGPSVGENTEATSVGGPILGSALQYLGASNLVLNAGSSSVQEKGSSTGYNFNERGRQLRRPKRRAIGTKSL